MTTPGFCMHSVAVSPCWIQALPGVISANLSSDPWTLTTVADRVRLPVSSPITSAFPKSTGLDHMSPFNDFRTVVLSRLPSFVDLQASEFAVTQVVPTARQPIDCQGQP